MTRLPNATRPVDAQALAGEEEARPEREGVAEPVGLAEHRAAQREALAADRDRVADPQAEARQGLGRDDDAAVGEQLGERASAGERERAVEREVAVDGLELDELAAAGASAVRRAPRRR